MNFAQKPLDFNAIAVRERAMARNADPDTSHAAASDAKVHASASRRLVLEHLSQRPLNDFELAARTGKQQTSIGKRRGECVEAGWVEPDLDAQGNKVKRPSPSGSLSMVWRITQHGRVALKYL